RARVWYLERTPSVCAGCANGCNIEIYHREGRIFRFQPRPNAAVNQYWMCDEGRLSCEGLQGEGRLLAPLVRQTDRFEMPGWDAALAATGERLRALVAEHGGQSVGVVVSAQAPNEEIHLARRLATALGARAAGISWSPAGASHDDFLLKADKNPNTAGLKLQGLDTDGAIDTLLAAAEQGTLRGLVLCRTDLSAWRDAARVHRALEALACVVVIDSERREVAQFADVVLPIGTYAESDGTFTNHAFRVQRFATAVVAPGETRAGWTVLAELLQRIDGSRVPADAAAVFAQLAADVGAFRGLTLDGLGDEGRVVAS